MQHNLRGTGIQSEYLGLLLSDLSVSSLKIILFSAFVFCLFIIIFRFGINYDVMKL